MLGENKPPSTAALTTISALSFVGLGLTFALATPGQLGPLLLTAFGTAAATTLVSTRLFQAVTRSPQASPNASPNSPGSDAQLSPLQDAPSLSSDPDPAASAAPHPAPSEGGVVNLFAHAFEALPIGLAILTARDGCFLDVNSRFLQFTGHERDDVISLTDDELNLWENRSAKEQFMERLTVEGAVKGAQCQLRNKDGNLVNAVVSLIQVKVNETPCAILTVQDPGEYSHLEAQILQSQKMDAVGQLAAGLAHDFNNILMIVQGYTSLLQADKDMTPSSNDALEQVSVAANRAAQLTRQLLTFSRKQIMHPKTVQLNSALQGMRDTLRQTLGPEIHLSTNLAPDTPPIEADLAVMEEGIKTLALNARDSLAEGGDFRLETARVDIDSAYVRTHPEARTGVFARLTVQDTGVGMDPAAVSRVFEPFFTSKEIGHGSGLGLATVYGIVKQHNGWIDVRSQPGQGTTFDIFLPASAKAPARDPSPGPAPSLTGTERILVVEDEPGLRSLVCSILERYGYTVVTASHGTEALAVWQEHQGEFDLLLTDMIMPEGLSGRELAEKLWVQKPDLKVIFTSGYSVDLLSDDIGAFAEGVNFIQKPYRPTDLAETIRRCLGGFPTSALVKPS